MVRLKYSENRDFIVFNKPVGLNSHAVDQGKEGLVEFLCEKLNQKYHLVSRLDQGTSGLILLAKDSAVQKLNELWNTDKTRKTYLLLTDKKLDLDSFSKKHPTAILIKENSNDKIHFHIKTDIQKKGKDFQSLFSNQTNAETEFIFEKQIGSFFLWQAILHTGKTHQIRLHCQNLNIPLLGDELYQGSPFYRLCLHSWKLQILEQEFQSELPLWAQSENLTFLKRPSLEQKVLESLQQRKQMYDLESDDCFRWLHQEVTGLKLDQYGKVLYMYDYNGYTKDSLSLPQLISADLKLPLFVRQMQDRGDDPNQNYLFIYDPIDHKLVPAHEPSIWQAKENNTSFELRTHQGLSPGLFLDQRENRKWVLENTKDKKVLNLFSYTSGFSVLSALGKAKEIDTVDVSQNFIEWSKRNFEINQAINPESYRFWVQDCLFFMKMSVKKEKKWDLIICDPPTFGRSKNGVFQIEKNFDELLQNIFTCTEKQGRILFSLNFEKWSQQDLLNKVEKALKGKKFAIEKTPFQSLDFDFPHHDHLMKSLFISRL